MTNEQTPSAAQAEKLADQIVWDEEWTDTERCCGGKNIHTGVLEKLIVRAIEKATDQALAELREENERLGEALELCATHDPFKDMVGDGSTHCGFIANKAKEALQNTQHYSVLRTENERLKKELSESNQLCKRLIHTSELEREAIWQYRLKVSSDPNLPHWDASKWSNLEWIQEQIQAWARTRESLESTKAENERLNERIAELESEILQMKDGFC